MGCIDVSAAVVPETKKPALGGLPRSGVVRGVTSGAAIAPSGIRALAARAMLLRAGVRVARRGLAVRTMRGPGRRTLPARTPAAAVLRDRRVEANLPARRVAFDHVHDEIDLQ